MLLLSGASTGCRAGNSGHGSYSRAADTTGASAVEILSRSETKTVRFGVADNQAHGRVFVNTSRGLVFVGSQLPALARDRTFQLWLIPAARAPQSAGLFRPNAAGNFVNVRTQPIDTARIQAVAVSVEPQGGSPAPTTKPILIVPLGAG